MPNEMTAAEAIAARDREWMEVLHPGNANTHLGEKYKTPEQYRGFRHAQDCLEIENGEWFGKLQNCLARLSIALYGHDQAYYDSDDSDGDNWRDNIDRFTLTLVNLIQSSALRPASLPLPDGKWPDALDDTDRTSYRQQIGAAIKGATARAGNWPKDAQHGYAGVNAEAWLWGWQWCNDSLSDPEFVQPPAPHSPAGGQEEHKCHVCGAVPEPSGERIHVEYCSVAVRDWPAPSPAEQSDEIDAKVGEFFQRMDAAGEQQAAGTAGEECKDCGGWLSFSARSIGDGLCHRCAHLRLAGIKEAGSEEQFWKTKFDHLKKANWERNDRIEKLALAKEDAERKLEQFQEATNILNSSLTDENTRLRAVVKAVERFEAGRGTLNAVLDAKNAYRAEHPAQDLDGGPTFNCGECGMRMTLVRPGKHQCDNQACPSNQEQP